MKLSQKETNEILECFKIFCRTENPELDEKDYFMYFCQLSPKEQSKFHQETAKRLKLKDQQIRDYIFLDFAQQILDKMDVEDKQIIKDICFSMCNEQFIKIYDQVMQYFQSKQKAVHIETVKQSIHYYMKQVQKMQQKDKKK